MEEKKIAINYEKIAEIAEKNGLTNRQKQLVTELIKNPARTAKDILLSAGYSDSVAITQPKAQLVRDRLKSSLADYLSSEVITKQMSGIYNGMLDMKAPDEKRELSYASQKLKAMDQIHKIRGDYAPTRKDVRTSNIRLAVSLGADDS